MPLRVDVQDPARVDSMVGTVIACYGRLDCMVNSAGIGSGVAILCSGDARFITGHVLVVDGGFSGVGLTVSPGGEDAVTVPRGGN